MYIFTFLRRILRRKCTRKLKTKNGAKNRYQVNFFRKKFGNLLIRPYTFILQVFVLFLLPEKKPKFIVHPLNRGVECWKGIFRLGDLLAGKYHIRYRYCTLYIIKNPTRPMIDDSNCHGDKALTMKPTSVLTKIISRINYLSLARSRIDLLIGISPHIFTN